MDLPLLRLPEVHRNGGRKNLPAFGIKGINRHVAIAGTFSVDIRAIGHYPPIGFHLGEILDAHPNRYPGPPFGSAQTQGSEIRRARRKVWGYLDDRLAKGFISHLLIQSQGGFIRRSFTLSGITT